MFELDLLGCQRATLLVEKLIADARALTFTEQMLSRQTQATHALERPSAHADTLKSASSFFISLIVICIQPVFSISTQ